MASCFLNKKGQISIEFVLILLIGLIYLNTISSAVIYPAIDSAKDVSNVGEARLASEKIVNSINELSVSPGDGKKTIRVFVPENTTISCDSFASSIKFAVKVSSTSIQSCKTDVDGDDAKCTKSFSLPGVSLDASTCGSVVSVLSKKGFFTLAITKTGTGLTSNISINDVS